GTIGADRLALALANLEPADERRTDHKADHHGGQNRAAGAEGEIAEDVEERRCIRKICQKVKHLPLYAPRAFSASMITDMRLPNEPLTRTTSPFFTRAISSGAKSADVAA